jgi:hypothetical protein
LHITPEFEYFRNFIYIGMENYYQPNNLKMKKIILLITNVLIGVTLSAQTMVFNVQEIKAKEFTENKMEEAYETCCADMKPNKGGFALQVIGKGADNGMTHRLIWYWELGEDLWEGTDIDEKAPLWWSQMDNYVEEYGESYMGRGLSRQEGTNEDYKWTHFYDFKVDDPNQFKIGHDKIVNKFKKEFEGRWVGFGTYDINRPNGATHWVGISGENNVDHVMLLDKLQSQSEFIKMLAERGKSENVRDYMIKNIKTY